jgi:hypothetical protein
MTSRHAAVVAALAATLSLSSAVHAATPAAPATPATPSAPATPPASAPEVSAFDVPAAKPVRFEFARIKSAIPVDDVIGYGSTGMFCMGHQVVRASPKLDEVNTLQAGLAFTTELAAAGLALAAPEVSAFDNAGPNTEPDYRVGGVLQALSFEECVDGRERKGSINITVKWEVFAPKLQKVVLTRVITGSVKTDSFETVAGRDFEMRAHRWSPTTTWWATRTT